VLCFSCRKNKTQNEGKQNKEHNTENLKDYQYRCQEKQSTEWRQTKQMFVFILCFVFSGICTGNLLGFLYCVLCFVCPHSVFCFSWHLYW
jgi:fatty-acid desaturase